jgi:Leucine-rich repeat (LRR) protein
MRLKLDKNTDAISPAIGQLKNLHTIALIINYSVEVRGGVSIPPERQDVTIPLELLNLPNLRTLEVNGALNLRLPPAAATSHIQSHIEQVIAIDWAKNSIPFLANLPILHQLILLEGEGAELPAGFDRLHKLRELRIERHTQPLALGESLCGFANLEELELSTQLQSPLPACLERLNRLKKVTMASCRREALPDKKEIHFPTALLFLANLEELTLWDAGRIEMPGALYGFEKLRTLTISKYPAWDVYIICPEDRDDCEQNLDAVIDYPNLQTIIVGTAKPLVGSVYEITHSDAEGNRISEKECDEILGIRRFIDLVDAAWKEGKLSNLTRIDMSVREENDIDTRTVWKRPASRKKSGNIIPASEDEPFWLLKEERERILYGEEKEE